MTKQYTVADVANLQAQKAQLEQRLAVHKQRALEKQAELNKLFAENGVTNIQELSQLCASKNAEMQAYAVEQEQEIQRMAVVCAELDSML